MSDPQLLSCMHAMGFASPQADAALAQAHGDVESAIELLLSGIPLDGLEKYSFQGERWPQK